MNDHTLENLAGYYDTEDEDPRPRSSLWVIVLVFILLVAIVSLFLLDWLYNPEKFRIEEVEIHGQLEHVDTELIRSAVASELDGNYFSARLEDIEGAIRTLPWVFDASVRRRWPSTLVVGVDEVRPVAAWGSDRWLNASGDLVEREPWDGSLPVLDGPENMKEVVWRAFREWQGLFADQGLSLDRLEFDERELWYMTLSFAGRLDRRRAPEADAADRTPPVTAAVVMIVDNLDAGARIQRLISALNSQLISEFPNMRSVDLRYPNGFAIHWAHDAPDVRGIAESN